MADADGLWAISFGADQDGGFGDYYMKAKLTVDLTKALAAGGVDLGDLTIKASIGNQDTENMSSAYGNYSGRNYQQLKATSNNNDPEHTLTSIDLGYGKLVSGQYKFDPTGKLHQGISAVVTPVDGVKVSATYVQKGKGKRFFGKQGDSNWIFQGAADVDVNKFINVDKLTLKAGLFYDFANKDYAAGKEQDYSRFFDRFYRADESHSSEKSGYGIGLSMAEGIARMYRGKIRAEWKAGVMYFTVTFP